VFKQFTVVYAEDKMKIIKHTALSEQFWNPINKLQKEAKLIPIIHTYMTAHFPDLVRIRKVAVLS